jgi:pimeloyl-ACP methyl ester carboxylesterase
MNVYFSHGKESGPWGTKIKRLATVAKNSGCAVDSIDYTDLADPDDRVQRLVQVLQEEQEQFVLVGSSMGGYVSLVAAEQFPSAALFLLAPALFMSGYGKQAYSSPVQNIEIVHGWSDTVIPPENSIKFAQQADCSLHLISGDHRLNSSIEAIERIFDQFLCDLLGR